MLIFISLPAFGLEREDFSLSVDQVDEHAAQIKEYVLYNYRPLVIDVVNGQGIYIDNMALLFQGSCINFSVISHELKVALERRDTINQYASFASELFKDNLCSVHKKIDS